MKKYMPLLAVAFLMSVLGALLDTALSFSVQGGLFSSLLFKVFYLLNGAALALAIGYANKKLLSSFQ